MFITYDSVHFGVIVSCYLWPLLSRVFFWRSTPMPLGGSSSLHMLDTSRKIARARHTVTLLMFISVKPKLESS